MGSLFCITYYNGEVLHVMQATHWLYIRFILLHGAAMCFRDGHWTEVLFVETM